MAFGDILSYNPATHQNSESGHVSQKMNELFQQDEGQFRLNLSTDGKNYIEWNATDSQIDFYIDETLEGYVNSSGFNNA